MKQQGKITLYLTPDNKAKLEKIASSLGFVRGKSPSISALIKAIAQGNLKISQPREEIAKAISIIEEQLKQLKML